MKSSKFYTIALLLALSQSSSVKAVESTGLKAVKAREAEEKAKQNALIQNSVDANLDLNLENLDDLIENFKTVKNDASNMAKGSMSLIKNQTMYNDSLLKLMKDIVKQSVNFLGDEVKSKFSNVLDKSYGISVVNTESDLKRYNILLDKDTKQLFEEFDGIISKKKEQIDSSDSDAKISEGFEKFSESFKSLVATMVEGSLNTNNEWKSTQTPENLKAIAKNNLNEIVKVLDTAINSAQKLKDAALANRESSHKKLQDSEEENIDIKNFPNFLRNFPNKLEEVEKVLTSYTNKNNKYDNFNDLIRIQHSALNGLFDEMITSDSELKEAFENYLTAKDCQSDEGLINSQQLDVLYEELRIQLLSKVEFLCGKRLQHRNVSGDIVVKIVNVLLGALPKVESIVNTSLNLAWKNENRNEDIQSNLSTLKKQIRDAKSAFKAIVLAHGRELEER